MAAANPREVLTLLAGKWGPGTRPKDLFAGRIAKSPERYLPVLLEGLRSEHARVRNGCAELLSLTAEARADLLVPHFAALAANLEATAPVLRWEAVCQLGWLAAQVPARAAGLVPRLVPLLASESVVLQGHTVRALARIGVAAPATAAGILEILFAALELFPANGAGFLVEACEQLLAVPGLAPRVEALVRPLAGSEVAVVARKAAKVLRRVELMQPVQAAQESAGRSRRKRNPMPSFVATALRARGLEPSFRARPAYQQNDYLGWIGRAKRDTTKQQRLSQMLDELARGGVYMKMRWRSKQPR